MISVTVKDSKNKTRNFLQKCLKPINKSVLDKYGKQGVELLKQATPKDSGKTSESWNYEIKTENGKTTIVWNNSNTSQGVNIAILIQYGHGTRNGAFVQGVDYINPAMQPLFDKIRDEIWKEVTK